LTPLVSIVLPVYNAAPYLREALTSIARQTYRNLEVITVDDGSTDDSAAILDEFARKDGRFRIIGGGHRGIVAALNAGLDAAHGDYIARMDADDSASRSRIAKQVRFMESRADIDLCSTWARLAHPTKHYLYRSETAHEAIRCSLVFTCDIVHPTVMARRAVFDEPGARYDPAYEFAEDYELWTRLLRHHEMAILPIILLEYRGHEGSVQVAHKAMQEQRVRRLYTRLLKELGMAPDDNELDLHRRIGTGSFAHSRSELFAIEQWLVTIVNANDVARVYDGAAMRAYFAKKYYAVCTTCTSRRLDGLALFRKSAFARDYAPTVMQRIRQSAKRWTTDSSIDTTPGVRLR
jgi:glycosyltransferase involved in cell wall biosynthesis